MWMNHVPGALQPIMAQTLFNLGAQNSGVEHKSIVISNEDQTLVIGIHYSLSQ
jgi:hypothetical protein